MASDKATDEFSRRQFLSGTVLTTAGAATGLSYFFSKDNVPRPRPEEVRLGFIGVGSRGSALLRAALRVPGSNVVHLCDKRQAVLDGRKADVTAMKSQMPDGKQQDQVKTTLDWRDLIDDPRVEGVVIATPHYLHGPMALAALEAGKHVYCEKAMAYSIGECKDIYRLATELKEKQVFQVGHQRHYSKMYQKVKAMFMGGRIGNIVGARAQWNRNDEVRRPCEDPKLEKLINWRLYSEFSGGLMSEFSSHQVDVINMVLNSHPESVCGMGGHDYPRYSDDRDTTDNVQVVFTYDVDWRELVEDKNSSEGWRFVPTGKKYPVRFSYMSIMTNALLGPSEIVLGDEGSIEVTLGGGDFWKEAKVLRRRDKIEQGTNPFHPHQKSILVSGGTIAAVEKGRRPPDLEIKSPKEKTEWSEFTGLKGGHTPLLTLRALDGFLGSIRKARNGQPYYVSANVKVGLWGAVPCILANIAMKENRTVHWQEFFQEDWWEESFEKDWPDQDLQEA